MPRDLKTRREKSLALALLSLGSLASWARAGDDTQGDLHLSGSVVVFVLPTASGPSAPAVESFRKVLAKVRPRFEANGVKVVESGPVLLQHGSFLQRSRKIDFRRTRDFVGTVFFQDDHEPQIQRGTETEGEILSRAERYFRWHER
jgi:hypothetical protein